VNAFSDALYEVFSCAAETYSAKGLQNLLANTAALYQCKPGMLARWVQCEDFLYTNVMLPVVSEIIHVFELFVRLEAKVRESDLIGIIGEADAALVSDTIKLAPPTPELFPKSPASVLLGFIGGLLLPKWQRDFDLSGCWLSLVCLDEPQEMQSA
jgi:hypothetical protein